MKKFIFSVIFCLVTYGFAFAQPKFPELDKIKQIKLLESTRDDVKKIFSEYAEDFEGEEDGEDEDDEGVVRDEVSTENMTIFFAYALGTCSDDDEEAWNVAKGKVTEINVLFKKSVKAKDLKIDLAKLERIVKYERDEDEEEDPDDYVYYDKKNHVSYGLSDGEIENIKFTPSEENLTALCSNETVREYASNKEWLVEKLKYRPYIETGRQFVNVSDLILDKSEVSAYCDAALEGAERCSEYMKITVETKTEGGDPTDVLTYNYTISGGKIIGTGANVTWDLNGVKAGEYTITAGVDNGCGVCGTTKTQTVVVKDCPDCKQKDKK